jgi:hypothetical protein
MNQIIEIHLEKPHHNQQHILNTSKRFNVLKCGRRFGKSSLAVDLIINPALDGFPVAYYAPTYKDLEEFWIKVRTIVQPITATKSEQTKKITLITGGVIDMWSMDDPDSGRGRKYKRVVIDECEKAKHLSTAWNGTIRATLTDFKGDSYFLSTPQFGNTYFKDLFKRKDEERYQHEWQGWKFTTYDNPFMDADEIDSAKATLDPMYFACEYLAEDVTLNAMRWAYAYEPEKHLADHIDINPGLPIIVSFDFNRNPMCATIAQINEPHDVYVIETIKIPNSDIYQMCEVIRTKYGHKLLLVTGDASGNSSSAMVKDNLNYYRIIMNELNVGKGQLMIPTVNPPLERNRMLVNSLLSRGNVKLDRQNTKELQFDLENVAVGEDGKIKKDNRSDITQQADALDTFRYLCNTFLNRFLEQI